jgi:hypothetical protein
MRVQNVASSKAEPLFTVPEEEEFFDASDKFAPSSVESDKALGWLQRISLQRGTMLSILAKEPTATLSGVMNVVSGVGRVITSSTPFDLVRGGTELVVGALQIRAQAAKFNEEDAGEAQQFIHNAELGLQLIEQMNELADNNVGACQKNLQGAQQELLKLQSEHKKIQESLKQARDQVFALASKAQNSSQKAMDLMEEVIGKWETLGALRKDSADLLGLTKLALKGSLMSEGTSLEARCEGLCQIIEEIRPLIEIQAEYRQKEEILFQEIQGLNAFVMDLSREANSQYLEAFKLGYESLQEISWSLEQSSEFVKLAQAALSDSQGKLTQNEMIAMSRGMVMELIWRQMTKLKEQKSSSTNWWWLTLGFVFPWARIATLLAAATAYAMSQKDAIVPLIQKIPQFKPPPSDEKLTVYEGDWVKVAYNNSSTGLTGTFSQESSHTIGKVTILFQEDPYSFPFNLNSTEWDFAVSLEEILNLSARMRAEVQDPSKALSIEDLSAILFELTDVSLNSEKGVVRLLDDRIIPFFFPLFPATKRGASVRSLTTNEKRPITGDQLTDFCQIKNKAGSPITQLSLTFLGNQKNVHIQTHSLAYPKSCMSGEEAARLMGYLAYAIRRGVPRASVDQFLKVLSKDQGIVNKPILDQAVIDQLIGYLPKEETGPLLTYAEGNDFLKMSLSCFVDAKNILELGLLKLEVGFSGLALRLSTKAQLVLTVGEKKEEFIFCFGYGDKAIALEEALRLVKTVHEHHLTKTEVQRLSAWLLTRNCVLDERNLGPLLPSCYRFLFDWLEKESCSLSGSSSK